MARPKYPKPLNQAYNGELSKVRYCLDRAYDLFNNSPAFKPDFVATLKTFATATAINLNQYTSTQALVTNGQKIAGVTGSGTFANIAIDPVTKVVTVTLTAS
jgi:hypothetical protein